MAKKTGSAASKPGWWSWREVVENRRLLGIPHFQRGSVWDHGNRVALLESLFHASPCGSFVLWRPEKDAAVVGGPLLLSEADRGGPWEQSRALWLVDGQQRSRSLLALYNELLRNNDASRHLLCRQDVAQLGKLWPRTKSFGIDSASQTLEDDESEERPNGESDAHTSEPSQESDAGTRDVTPNAIWFVSIPALQIQSEHDGKPLFSDWGSKTRTTRGSAFRLAVPAFEQSFKPRGKKLGIEHGLIPLAYFLARDSFAWDVERARVLAALDAFVSGKPAPTELNELLPWGPHFLLGLAGAVNAPTAGPRWFTWEDVKLSEETRKPLGDLRQLYDGNASLFSAFQQMLAGPRFATGFLPSSSVREAIDAYVRINRAGIRVRTEERALAEVAVPD